MPRKPGTEMQQAWSAVTANLPADWSVLELIRMEANGPRSWYASAGRYTGGRWDGAEVIESEGSSAARCLGNLAKALERRKGRRGPPPRDRSLPPIPPRSVERLLYRSPDLGTPAGLAVEGR